MTAAVAGLGACAGPETVRYRLSLAIDTPDGLKSGSGVIEVSASYNDGLFRGLGAGPGQSTACRGEAIAIDLGEAGWLFVMLTRDRTRHGSMDAEGLPVAALRSQIPSLEWRYDKSFRHLAQKQAKGDVPLLVLPLLVRFRDGKDPLSAERVDPANLGETFGAGFELREARIEMTRSAVTWSLAKRFPWVRDIKGSIGVSRGLNDQSLGYMHILSQINSSSLMQGS